MYVYINIHMCECMCVYIYLFMVLFRKTMLRFIIDYNTITKNLIAFL